MAAAPATRGMPDDLIDQVAAREQRELESRENLYRRSSAPLNVIGRTVILVDDGLGYRPKQPPRKHAA
jgi:predicted phosphoribosyltransferase